MPNLNGIVIHPDAIIVPNCLIFQQVAIGTIYGSAKPIIGGHVDIGAAYHILKGMQSPANEINLMVSHLYLFLTMLFIETFYQTGLSRLYTKYFHIKPF